MTTGHRAPTKWAALLLAIFSICSGVSSGQSLYDVVISLSDRHRAISQREQVATYLENQNNNPSEPDAPIPADEPITWGENLGTNPDQSVVENLDMGGKIAVLNQALVEFDKMRGSYLNLRPADLAAGSRTGTLRPFMQEDFPVFGRVTAENFPVVLAGFARQVRHLSVLPWSASLKKRKKEYYQNRDESIDSSGNVADNPGAANPDFQPLDSWEPGALQEGIYKEDPQWVTARANSPYLMAFESVEASGGYTRITYNGGPPNGTTDYSLQSLLCSQYTVFFSDARTVVTPPGILQTVPGKVVLVAHNEYSSAKADSFDSLPDAWKPDDGAFHVIGESAAGGGDVVLSNNGPGIVAKLKWSALQTSGDTQTRQGRPDCDRSPESWKYRSNLRRNIYPLFVPAFSRGLDASGVPEALAQAARVQRPPAGDGQVMLHPLPGLLIGVPLGVGLDGDGSTGWIGVCPGSYDYLSGRSDHPADMFATGILSPGFTSHGGYTNADVAIRFDYSANLRFVGAAEDFHVVYATGRGTAQRGSPLPVVSPTNIQLAQSGWEDQSVILAWDLPRIRQIVGRDLVADISTQGHYKTTVAIYHRNATAAAVNRTPGELVSLSDLTLIRTLVFENPNNTANNLFFASPEIVKVTDGSNTYTAARDVLAQDSGSVTFTGPTWQEAVALSGNATSGYGATVTRTLDGNAMGTTVHTGDLKWRWWKYRVPGMIVHTPAGGSARTSQLTLDSTPGCRDGIFPKTITNSGGDLPASAMGWNARGQLVSASDGSWKLVGTDSSGMWKTQIKLGDAASGPVTGTTWVQFTDGTRKVKIYSAPDGSIDGPGLSSVAWSEVEYGTSTDGLPGLPRIVRNSDGSGATYGWSVGGDGSYIFTLREGVFSGPTGTSIIRGSQLISNIDARGYPSLTKSSWIDGNLQLGGATFSDPSSWGAPRKSKDYNTSLESTWAYDGERSRIASFTSGLGLATTFTNFDPLDRARKVSANGITADTTFTGLNTSTAFSGTNITAGTSASTTRDGLGRLLTSNVTWNGVADNLTATPGSDPIDLTHVGLFGTHHASVRKDDGTLTSASGPTMPFDGTTGTALAVENGLLKSTHKLGNPAAVYQTVWTDAWGRVRRTATPSTSGGGVDETRIDYSDPTSNSSDAFPKRVIVTDAAGRVFITESDPYSTAGAIGRSGIDVNGNGKLDGSDRYVESVTTVSGTSLITVTNVTEDSGLREAVRTTWTPSSDLTETKINGSEETIKRTPNYSAKTIKTESTTKGWTRTETANALGLTVEDKLIGTGLPDATLTPTWKADGSLSGVSFKIDSETHGATFNSNGTLASLTAPGRGNILGGHTISGGFETLVIDGVTTTWKLDGTKETVSGSDVVGRTEELSRNGSGFKFATTPATGGDTSVALNSAGAATAKNYPAGLGETYVNGSGGLLNSVTLARGGSLTFGYSSDRAKDLVSASWPAVASGSLTAAAVSEGYSYDRAGRTKTIGDASGGRSLAYSNGRLSETAWNSGPLSGYRIVRSYDGGRETGFDLWRGSTLIHSGQKALNLASDEIAALTSGGLKVVVGRNGARQVTGFQWGNVAGTFIPTATQTWQRGTAGRILSATNNVTGAPAFDYRNPGNPSDEASAFDGKGRRLKCTTAGGTWTYTYTNGRLTGASHSALGTFNYQFDAIGRRTEIGANAADALNRIRAWTNSQNKTLKITAHPSARLWVNGTEVPGFTGSYSYAIPSPGPSGGWVPWNTLAVLAGQGDPGANPNAEAERSGAVWVPPVSETIDYDDAGNRQRTALWDYCWNAKNELVRARTRNYDSTAQGYDITFDYDAEGRRFRKTVTRYQSGAIAEEKTTTFVWDGWDLLYERQQMPGGLTTLERKYLWGPDIGDGGAGGAGGLLLIRETQGNQTRDLYPLYDGSGHLTALTDSSRALLASYAYGPFGELIQASGPLANSNPWRYASKYYDAETGLYYFGKRYFDPVTGQWLSREPLGESKSVNLYSYCHNDPVNRIDVLGLEEVQANSWNPFTKKFWTDGTAANFRWLVGLDHGGVDAGDRMSQAMISPMVGAIIENDRNPAQAAIDRQAGRKSGIVNYPLSTVESLSGMAVGTEQVLGKMLFGSIEPGLTNEQVESVSQSFIQQLGPYQDMMMARKFKGVIRADIAEDYGADLSSYSFSVGEFQGQLVVDGSFFVVSEAPAIARGTTDLARPVFNAISEGMFPLYRGQRKFLPGAIFPSGIKIPAANTTVVRTGSYGTLVGELEGTGLQANHLNQNAAFRAIIPEDEGLAVGMRGNAFTEIGSPHYAYHASLEEFWTPYRKGGSLFGQLPTNAAYGAAVEQALIRSGYTPAQAANIAAQAAAQRTAFGLISSAPVPRIPGRLPQAKP